MARFYACTRCGKRTTSLTRRCPAHETPSRPSARPYQRVRLAVLERDGYRCQECGNPVRDDSEAPLDERAHVDHIVRHADGGHSRPTNLRTLCARCNHAREAEHR